MPLGLIGRKIGMGQIFKDGKVVAVTVIKAEPCTVVQKKDIDRDGYQALQLGYGELKRPTKPLEGHFKKAGVSPKRILREFRVDNVDEFEVGQEIKADIFTQGERVKITGISKGKGFCGGVKRWGFRGGRATHGSMFHRAPGSISTSAFPSRVFKGKRLPGRMGSQRVAVKRVEVVGVNVDNNTLIVKGAVPGHYGSILLIEKIA